MRMYRRFTLADQLVRLTGSGWLLYVAWEGLSYGKAPEVALVIGGVGLLTSLTLLIRYEKV